MRYENFPHICFESRDKDYDKAENALTIEGLVKTSGMILEKDDTFFLEDAINWVTGWDVSPKQKTLDESLTKWREEVDRAGRAIREAESERQSLRARLRSGAQLQACANEFSDIDGLGLSSRIAELEEEERVIVGGSDVLKKLKDDHTEVGLFSYSMLYAFLLGMYHLMIVIYLHHHWVELFFHLHQFFFQLFGELYWQ